MSQPKKFGAVFADLSGRRAAAVNVMIAIAIILVIFVAIVIVNSLFLEPGDVVPTLRQSNATGALPESYLPISKRGPPLHFTQSRRIPPTKDEVLRFAYLSGTPAGFASLIENATHIDAVIADQIKLLATTDGFQLHEVEGLANQTEWLRANVGRVLIYPKIESEWTNKQALILLTDDDTRRQLIERVLHYLKHQKFPGVVLDVRTVPSSARREIALLLSELEAELKTASRKLLVIVDPTIDIPQLRYLAARADYIVAATHRDYIDGDFGPPTAQAWFEDHLRKLRTAVPSSKLVVSIGSYSVDTNMAGDSQVVPVQRAWDIMAGAGTQLMFDGNSLNGSFRYHDNRGLPHQVWLLDAVTVFNQTRAALAAEPAGIALWRLGFEDAGAWSSFSRKRFPDAAALETLKTVQPSYGTFQMVNGAVITAQPGEVGTRSFSYNNALGLIVHQQMERLPSRARVSALAPVRANMVALTFDDGPDPKYTTRILDILAEKGVKATFYNTGWSSFIWHDLVRREYLEGHDIGNHTFSHTGVMNASAERLVFEINATSRILQSITGTKMRLFRTPYAGPGFAHFDKRPEVVVEATKLGYMIGGLDAESCDWCGVSQSYIGDAVINAIIHRRRQVVLMHDGGGDREAVIAALPDIIDKLRAAGYQFVTTHELVGLSRTAVMEPVPPINIVAESKKVVWTATLAISRWAGTGIPILAMMAIVIGILRATVIATMAILQSCRRSNKSRTSEYAGPVAVIVPAYNEEPTICNTVGSILASTVADKLDVIVIDDGSTDGTIDTLMAEFSEDRRVRVIRKDNGGKSSAMNAGIAVTTAPVLVAIDGDTILLPEAIERLTAHFSDPSIGAVAGNVKVGNVTGLLTAFQALEYITSQNLDRRAFELCNAIAVVPGAIGAWRREALLEIGSYSNDTLAEDADLTFAVQRRGWRIICEPKACALTEAPEKLSAFLKQRFRWLFGTLQVTFKHSGALFEQPRGISLVAIPNVIIFLFVFTLIAPVLDAILVWSVTSLTVSAFSGTLNVTEVTIIAWYWCAFQAVDLFAAAVGLALDGERRYWRLMPLVILQRFSYRQLLYVTAVRALFVALKGTAAGWGKLIRTGNVVPLHRV